MNGKKAKQLRNQAMQEALAVGDKNLVHIKAYYRHLKGRPQKRVGLNEPKVNAMQVPSGINEDGTQKFMTVPKWTYFGIDDTTYEVRQPKRYHNRNKY